MMNKYLFYPGCSMEASAKAYNESMQEILRPLGLDFQVVDDWNCCGATEYVSISLTPAYSLIARNLALAVKQADGADTVVASCSACYLNLAKADHYMEERPLLGRNVNTALSAGNLHYKPGSLKIRHLLDVIVNDVGLETVQQQVTHPLKGLRLAPYVGCMVPRPDYEHRWSDTEYPTELDRLLKALGADVIDFPLKTHCCGGHMTQIGPETAYELMRRLIHAADQYHADMMVTLCPMCQLNLDAYQNEMNRYFKTNYRMPILFFTQLVGLALGIEPGKLGFGREIVSAKPALSKIGVEAPESEESKAQPKRTKKTGLPMPTMPGQEEVEQ
jgi:heterodisulfide reductase subunit B